jgi:hypothetical protein
MTPPTSPVDNSLMAGSLHESTQHIELQGITTDTRARALRLPCWAVVVAVQVLAGGTGRDVLQLVLAQLGGGPS